MRKRDLLKIINRAAKERVIELNLSGNNLKVLPPEIGQLTNLKILFLYGNKLAELPTEIGLLTNLNKFGLNGNQLTTLPREIGLLTNLHELDLSDNQLTKLPTEVGLLANLHELNLSANRLTLLPREIGLLSNLNELNLSDNQLTTLPTEIEQLVNLIWLDLSNNQLTKLPTEIKQLVNLIWLNLNNNRLTTLPEATGWLVKLISLYARNNQLTSIPARIGQLTNLNELDIGNNKLTVLPDRIDRLINLIELDVCSNYLQKLPRQIGRLTNLAELYISDNQLTKLPSEIGKLINLVWLSINNNKLAELTPEIGQLINLRELHLENNQLSRLPTKIQQITNLHKLDLRGNSLPIPPEVLGTSWVSLGAPANILNYYFQLQQEQKRSLNEAKLLVVGQSTVGKTSLVKRLIEGVFNQHERKTEGIQIQPWQLPVKEQTIRLNVWDFGGQEIMHATHQFFLTKRSLYLLVLNARQDEDENRLEYWLKIIQSFGGTSPIIIVGNQVDQQPLDIDRRGLQTKYPQIKAIVETSCETGEGIDDLRSLITQEVDALEHIYDPLPLSWFTLKQQLEAIEHDYIPYTEYQQLCNTQGITDELSQTTLVGFLHDLGIVLNFYGDDRLEDTNVLNPQWVTNGVYRILNDNPLITEHRGILERSHLTRILDRSRYPRSKHLFIIDMMRKFELCFDLEGFHDQKFLLPDLLTKEEPYTGDWQNALPFQYHYKVLPTSIISRFIVRMNDKIHQHTYWRNGVVLAYETNIALIKADREDKKIFIRVTGTENGRRRFLTVIRAQFAAIHQTISGLDVDEKIPLPNHPEVEPIDYQHLLTLEELGETSFIPTGLKERVSVQSLLDGIESVQERRGKRDRNLSLERRDISDRVNIHIHNTNQQGDYNPMTENTNNLQGANIGNFANEVKDNARQQTNQHIHQAANQNLAEAAKEIKALLNQLDNDYDSSTPTGQAMISAKAIESIEKNPTLKARVVNALKEGGTTALEELVDHPAVKPVVALLKGFMDAK